MITSENIQQTPSFSNIKDTVQQRLILKKDSVKRIDHGVTLAFNTSFERYVEIEHPSEKERAIVRDLLDKKIQLGGGKSMYNNYQYVVPILKSDIQLPVPIKRFYHEE